MSATAQLPDVFGQAKANYTIYDLWPLLNLPGKPKPACKSPFREERHPSFSIFDGGKAWKDHATGEGGDVIDFVRVARAWTHAEIREFFIERLGIDHRDPPTRTTPPPSKLKAIDWPCELLTGSEKTWSAFAKRMKLDPFTVNLMVEVDLLRFARVQGRRCYVITDECHRAAEIRCMDGKPFPNGNRKVFPLCGVDKSWLPGASFIKESPHERRWIICEGASDYLYLVDLYVRYRRSGGRRKTIPMAMLGAGVKTLCPEIMTAAQGRTIILTPDGDEAGEKMGERWSFDFSKAGADVDTILLPDGKDLRDMALRGEIPPEGLFDE